MNSPSEIVTEDLMISFGDYMSSKIGDAFDKALVEMIVNQKLDIEGQSW